MTDAESSIPPRSRAWTQGLLAILLAASLLNYADRQAFPVAAVTLKADLGLNNAQYGDIVGAFGLAFAAGSLIGGIVADMISVRWLFVCVLLGWSAAGIACGFANSYESVKWCRVALGACAAMHWPCALRTTQRLFAPENRPFANGFLQAGAPLGAILPSLCMLLLPDGEERWRQMFWLLGALGVPWTIIWLSWVRQRDFEQPALQTVEATGPGVGGNAIFVEMPLGRLFLSRRFVLLIFVVICINTCWHYIRAWMPLALEEQLKFSSDQTQVVQTAYWIAATVGAVSVGLLTRFFLARGASTHGARLGAFSCFTAATCLTLVAAFVGSGPLFVALMMVIGWGALGFFPIYYSLVQELSAKHQGKVGGVLAFSTWGVLYFVHPAVGRLTDANPDVWVYLFAAAGILPCLALAALVLFWRERPKAVEQ